MSATTLRPAEAAARSCVDFNVRGIVGVRLIDACESDAAAVTAQIGPVQGTIHGAADIEITFVDHLHVPPLTNVERGHSGFSPEGYYIRQTLPFRAAARLEIGDDRFAITCERGAEAIPLLIGLVCVSALRRRFVPLHASAFHFRGHDALLTGWSKGGKTEALLAFARHGAEYIGDEWILLSADGRRCAGIPEPIRLWDWQIEQIPGLHARISRSAAVRMRAVRHMDSLFRRVTRDGSRVPRQADKAMSMLNQQRNVRIAPSVLFGDAQRSEGSPSKLFVLASRDLPATEVFPADAGLVREQMLATTMHELSPVLGEYRAYRYAFPQRRCALMENLPASMESLLSTALRGMECFHVLHPYPVDFSELFAAMAGAFDGTGSAAMTRLNL
ncbi:MAG TPA: hypothetical protein VEG32_09435 [Clostridia bacterium]|nr:hypothetical protein [Clostridia bacterium]